MSFIQRQHARQGPHVGSSSLSLVVSCPYHSKRSPGGVGRILARTNGRPMLKAGPNEVVWSSPRREEGSGVLGEGVGGRDSRRT